MLPSVRWREVTSSCGFNLRVLSNSDAEHLLVGFLAISESSGVKVLQTVHLFLFGFFVFYY